MALTWDRVGVGAQEELWAGLRTPPPHPPSFWKQLRAGRAEDADAGRQSLIQMLALVLGCIHGHALTYLLEDLVEKASYLTFSMELQRGKTTGLRVPEGAQNQLHNF